jgi:outer membrane biosynthesis protein TonB
LRFAPGFFILLHISHLEICTSILETHLINPRSPPKPSPRRVVTDRQTLLVDPDTGKVVHVWRNVQATGHALQVREVLDKIAEDKEGVGGGDSGAQLSAPPPRPAVVEPEAAAPPPAKEAKVSAPPVRPVAKPPSASAPPPAAPASKAVESAEDLKEEVVVEVKRPSLRPSSPARDVSPAVSGQEPTGESPSAPVAKSASPIEEVKEVHPIEASMVGTLIGRGGARVKELSKLSGAFIKFEVDPPSMILGGTDEQRGLALKIATEWINDIGEESMELEGFVTGLLIGPKGRTIREIESKSGAVLRFEKDPEVMIVRGTSQERKDAMDMAR